MTSTGQEIGVYYGDMENNIPHGHGIKYYINDFIYDGDWFKGRKHGYGVITKDNLKAEVEYDQGDLVKVTKVHNNDSSDIIGIPIWTIDIKIENYYIEVKNPEVTFKYAYFDKGRMRFEGKCFNSKLKNLRLAKSVNGGMTYFGESDRHHNCTGYGEIEHRLYIYWGYVIEFVPNGSGVKVYKSGKRLEGEFKNGVLSGKGKISLNGMSIEGEFIRDQPVSDILFKNDEIISSLNQNNVSYIIRSLNWKNGSMISQREEEYYGRTVFTSLKLLIKFGEDWIHEPGTEHYTFPVCRVFNSKTDEDCPNKIELKINDLNWIEYEKKISVKKNTDYKLVENKFGRYQGEIKDSKFNGKGKMIFSNDESYFGQWKNNKMHGFGTYKYNDGSTYIGEFNNGNRHGIGSFIFPNNAKYQGRWANDKFHGKGILKSLDNNIEGIWKENKMISFKFLSKSQILFHPEIN